MTRSKNTGSNLHRLGLLVRLLILGAELLVLYHLLQEDGHPVTKGVLVCFVIITLIALILYYDRPVKNFNRMLQGLEYREGTFKLRHGSRSLGPDTHEYLNRLTVAFSQLVIERERQAHFFENILRINPSGILVISSDHKIKLYNESLVKILAISEPLTYDLLHQSYPELTQLIQHFENGQQMVQKLKIQGLSTWLSLTGSVMNLEGEDYQVIALEDVQKVATKKELETWEEMAKIITHEVKNSLSPIRLLMNQLLSWFRTNSEILGSIQGEENLSLKFLNTLESIENRTAGLMEFVEGYKALLHLPQPKKTRLSLAKLIDESIQVMHPEAQQKGIQLSGSSSDDIFIMADSQQIVQVVMNLIGNSIHFLNHVDRPVITISGMIESSRVTISVEDNGPGIPLELHEQVFTPFFSTRTEGTGIGLSFARKVLSQHKGDLRLMSIPGRTVFIIQLPAEH